MTAPLSVLILAGQRGGRVDPLAEAAGVGLKALAPVAGRAMVLRVLDTVAASSRVERIVVSVNPGSGLETLPEVADLIRSGRLTIVPSRENIVDSVLSALEGVPFPVLVTTADNVLLSPESLADIDDGARAQSSDVAVALARRTSVLSAHPDGQRRFYRFADDEYSNCNSYWIGCPEALKTAELFRTGGQFVKYPARVVGALGLGGILELIRFRFGLGTLEAGFRRLSKRFGLTIRPVVLTDGAVAIDVDSERTRVVAEQVIARRETAAVAA